MIDTEDTGLAVPFFNTNAPYDPERVAEALWVGAWMAARSEEVGRPPLRGGITLPDGTFYQTLQAGDLPRLDGRSGVAAFAAAKAAGKEAAKDMATEAAISLALAGTSFAMTRYAGEAADAARAGRYSDEATEVGQTVRNAGKEFEEKVQETFRKKIIRKNEEILNPDGSLYTEIDFETADAVFEVGLSLKGKLTQIRRQAEIAQARGKKLIVIYGPDTSPGTIRSYKTELRDMWGNSISFVPHP